MTQKGGVAQIKQALRAVAESDRINDLQRYFKTGPGEYAEGDKFIGLRVPAVRAVVKQFRATEFSVVEKLLASPWHEERLCALLLMIEHFKRADEKGRERIYRFYLNNTDHINNWDLVDVSTHKIVGEFLLEKERKPLYKLARSKKLWERRIAIIACFAFIRFKDFDDALKLSAILRDDEHDLIHKAVGWVLREIGKRDRKTEEVFLKEHYQKMPRTMLRYAIEQFPEARRKAYLAGRV